MFLSMRLYDKDGYRPPAATRRIGRIYIWSGEAWQRDTRVMRLSRARLVGRLVSLCMEEGRILENFRIESINHLFRMWMKVAGACHSKLTIVFIRCFKTGLGSQTATVSEFPELFFLYVISGCNL